MGDERPRPGTLGRGSALQYFGSNHTQDVAEQPFDGAVGARAQQRVDHDGSAFELGTQRGQPGVALGSHSRDTVLGRPRKDLVGSAAALPQVQTRMRSREAQVIGRDQSIAAIIARAHQYEDALATNLPAAHDGIRHRPARRLHHVTVGQAAGSGARLQLAHLLDADYFHHVISSNPLPPAT